MYRNPFSAAQRREAVAVLRSIKTFHQGLRTAFRPRDAYERALAREYRTIANDFAAALRPPDDKVDMNRLNALQLRSDATALNYMLLRGRPSGSSDYD